MLDQYTTTVITSAFTVIGTLGGALGVVFLSNRHSSKLEKSKSKNEKKDRERVLLEELCSLCFQVERDVATTLQIKEEIENSPPLPLTISEPINRMTVIVNMYYRSLKNTFDKYVMSIYELQNQFYVIYVIATRTNATPQSNLPEWHEYVHKTDIYKQRLTTLIEEIAKLTQQY